MRVELSEEAVEYGRQARLAFEAVGGDQLVQDAEREPEHRAAAVDPVLAELGAWDLDPRRSEEEREAAAALCRSAGWWAVPHPVAERLARPADLDVDGLVVVDEQRPEAAVDGLDLRWAAVTLDGRRSRATPQPAGASARSTAFVAGLDLEPLDHGGAADVALALVLPCWTLLGMLDRAIALTCAYVLDREQFGQALSTFQGVQFQLTDAEVERAGLEELAKHALWSVAATPEHAVADALGLRLAALEAAEVVLRIAHQLHGAIGFCDETEVSWLSRHSGPLRRLPFGPSATRERLVQQVGREGLTGLFDGVVP